MRGTACISVVLHILKETFTRLLQQPLTNTGIRHIRYTREKMAHGKGSRYKKKLDFYLNTQIQLSGFVVNSIKIRYENNFHNGL